MRFVELSPDGVVGALRGAKEVSLEGWGRIRMTGFARWAEAGCRALGFPENQFLNAYVTNQQRAMRIVFKQDVIARAVVLLIEQRPKGWRGNVEPLYVALTEAVRNGKQSAMLAESGWPKKSNWLGRRLRRGAPVLRKVAGIEVKFGVDLRPTDEGDKDGIEIIRGVGEYGE